MEITNNSEYRQALERLNALRDQAETPRSSRELAELEAAVEAYEARPDRPARPTGKPTPDPYGKDR